MNIFPATHGMHVEICIAHFPDGLGDTTAACKTAQLISEICNGSAELSFTAIPPDLSFCGQYLNTASALRDFEKNSLSMLSEVLRSYGRTLTEDPATLPKNRIRIITPYSGVCEAISDEIPTIVLSEYDRAPICSRPDLGDLLVYRQTGLGESTLASQTALGIHILPDWQWRHIFSQKPRETRYTELKDLKDWGSVLKGLETKIQTSLEGQIIFVGYGYDIKVFSRFVAPRLQEISEENQLRLHRGEAPLPDPVFFLPNQADNLRIMKNQLNEWFPKMTSVRYFCEKLSPKEFDLLLLLSEKKICITGDQSFAEAISSNKRIAHYDSRYHKMGLLTAYNKLLSADTNCFDPSQGGLSDDEIRARNNKISDKINKFICEHKNLKTGLISLFNAHPSMS